MRALIAVACCAGALAPALAHARDAKQYVLNIDPAPYVLRPEFRSPERAASASAGASRPSVAAERDRTLSSLEAEHRRRLAELDRQAQRQLRLQASLESLERDLQRERLELIRLREELRFRAPRP